MWREQHEGASDIYFNQQHKQLDLTTIAPKTTHWALRDLLKTMVVNSIVNYCQFGGTRIIRGNGHRKTRSNARPLAKAKQNKEIDNNHKCQVRGEK